MVKALSLGYQFRYPTSEQAFLVGGKNLSFKRVAKTRESQVESMEVLFSATSGIA
jgi:hypothetical protein